MGKITARDKGHIEEIKTILSRVEKDYLINLSSEKDWLDGLVERFEEK